PYLWGPNPLRSATRLYRPGSRFLITKCPWASVVTGGRARDPSSRRAMTSTRAMGSFVPARTTRPSMHAFAGAGTCSNNARAIVAVMYIFQLFIQKMLKSYQIPSSSINVCAGSFHVMPQQTSRTRGPFRIILKTRPHCLTLDEYCRNGPVDNLRDV